MTQLQLPYYAKALYEYKSDYEEDLNFSAGQLIKVTAIEDEEWVTGEYSDASGALKSGIFPKNFVGEALEEGKSGDKKTHQEQTYHQPEAEAEDEDRTTSEPSAQSLTEPEAKADSSFKTPVAADLPTPIQKSSPIKQPKIETPSISKGFSSKVSTFDSGEPVPAPSLSSNPFNKGHKSDVKPYQGHSSYIPPSINKTSTFTKQKNDLSHSSYVPPLLGRSQTGGRTEKSAEDAPPESPVADTKNDHFSEEEQEGPKLSLKERIALLQKQQADEAERQAAKKRQQKEAKAAKQASIKSDSTGEDEEADFMDANDVEAEAEPLRGTESSPKFPKITKAPTGGSISFPEGDEEQRVQVETESITENTVEREEKDDGDEEEEEEEDEEDEEEIKRAELRARMAKLAGAGGMLGVGGGFNPFGLPAGGPPKKATKKLEPKKEELEDQTMNQIPSAVPIMPFASSAAPEVPGLFKKKLTFEDEDANVEESKNLSENDNDFDTVKEDSPLNEEENQGREAPYRENETDEEEPLTKKLENLELSGTSRQALSESAIEGDDEEDEDDRSSSEEFQFSQRDRQREIKDLNLESKANDVYVRDIPQATQSDYTTGYESDDDTQFTKADESGKQHTQQTSVPKIAPPPLPSVDITPGKPSKAPPPPPPPSAAPASNPKAISSPSHKNAPPPPPIPPIPGAAAPPVPGGSGHSNPPPVPSSFSSSHHPHEEEKIVETDDIRSINSSIYSGVHQPHTFFHQEPVLEDEPFTPSKPSHTGASAMSNSSITRKLSRSSTGGDQAFSPSVKKASTFSASGTQEFHPTDVETSTKYELASKWWLRNELPSFLQQKANKELIYEVDENEIKRRDGSKLILKSFYVLHQDNKQTIFHLSYTVPSVDDSLDSFQALVKPPPTFDEHFLDAHSKDYGLKALQTAHKLINQTLSVPLISNIFQSLLTDRNVLPNVGFRSYGALIYSNNNSNEIIQYTVFKPGDIIAINKAKFQGHNKLRQKVIYDVGVDKTGPFAGIITEFDYEKKKFRVIELDSRGKVRQNSYKPSDMISGKIKVFRVVDRGYVNW